MSELLGKMAESLIAGKVDEVTDLTQQALDANVSSKDILEKGLLAGMEVVGKRFKANEMFIPEVLRCAKCMHGAMEILRPLLAETGVETAGTFVIGTVKGDLHDIGKNLVIMMLDGAGFEVIDLGIDVPPQTIVEAIRENQPNMLGLSALLTTTMPMIRTTIEAVNKSGLRDQIKIMIGGAPVDQQFADEVGADGYAPDASSATHLARSLSN